MFFMFTRPVFFTPEAVFFVSRGFLVSPFDFLCSFIVVFNELGDKVEVVVGGDHIPHHFAAQLAPVEDFKPFFLALVNVYGFHKPLALAEAVSGGVFVNVE